MALTVLLIRESFLGVRPMCLSKVRLRGKQLVYFSGGREVPIHRLYIRVFFDELLQIIPPFTLFGALRRGVGA